MDWNSGNNNVCLLSYSVSMATSAIRPVVYLKDDFIIGGIGTINNPYILK